VQNHFKKQLDKLNCSHQMHICIHRNHALVEWL